tara:strand:+ start:380 stop:1597 length:1218 start_codon:yes stop_codon:yes gene_type:complete
MADIGTLTPDQMLEQQKILRQQKMAEMLMQQGMQQPQGQMVSGRYVAPSIFQNLAGLANTYMGQRGIEKAEQAQLDLAKRLRADETSAMTDYFQQLQPKPAQPAPAGYELIDAGTPAIPANPRAALANLYANPKASPRLQNMAFNKLIADPEGFILPEGSTRVEKQPDGTYKVVASGGDKTSSEYKDYLMAQKDPIAPFKGSFVDYQTMNNRSKAPSVNVNTANKFATGFANKASEGTYNMAEQAYAAPQVIENAKRTIELVNSGAMAGTGADIALQAAKIFNVLGANNQDTITKTEQLFSNRGKAMLGSIKASGLAGSQGLTEGERKFLTQAEGGAITLDKETLKAMAGLEIKLAVQAQKRWNTQASKMDKEVLNATGYGPVEVYTGIGTIDTSNPLLAPKVKK